MLETMPRPPKPTDEQARPMTMRVPPDLWHYIAERAEAEDRSVNYIATRLMRLGYTAERGEPKP